MLVTYDVTVRVVIDVADYAAEYDIEGLPPHEVIQQVRQDLAQAELANVQHHDWIVRPDGINRVEWVSRDTAPESHCGIRVKHEPHEYSHPQHTFTCPGGGRKVTVRPWFRAVNGM